MFDQLTTLISARFPLDETDIALCRTYFEPLTGARNTTLEEQDHIPAYLYFISTGYMRLFYYDANGDEVTTTLCGPGSFLASYLSLVNGTKARENVACITDCTMLRIRRANLIRLIAESDRFKSFSLTIFEQAIAMSESRANDLATLSAEQRYRKLVLEQGQLIQNVPIQHIASYIGVKPQSLSRIRRSVF